MGDPTGREPPIRMGHIVGAVLALAFGGFLLSAVFGPPAVEYADQPYQELPAIDATVEELVAQFEENEVAALARYNGRTVRVTAQVRSIKAGADDGPLINLAWEETLLPVQASMDHEHSGFAANLRPGDDIALACTGVSEVLGTPMLSGCAPA